MLLLSIDVGIKNMAVCLMTETTIVEWEVLDVSSESDRKCCVNSCMSEVKFAEIVTNGVVDRTIIQDDIDDIDDITEGDTEPSCMADIYKFYCLKHAKKHDSLLVPEKKLNPNCISKLKITDLQKIASERNITVASERNSPLKNEIKNAIMDYIKDKYLLSVSFINATKLDMGVVGRNIKLKFDRLFKKYEITHLAIENQIGPLAERMKVAQWQVAQHFFERMPSIKIKTVSPSCKLIHCESDQKDTYAARKKTSVREILSGEILQLDRKKEFPVQPKWIEHFKSYKKKDDLADAFLQGMWVLNNCNLETDFK
jgi:hypothetical protein